MNKVYISQEKAELIHGKEVALAHHGVKGMKWGVRKTNRSSEGYQTRNKRASGAKEFKGMLETVGKNYTKINNAAAYGINKDLKALNKEWPSSKFRTASKKELDEGYFDKVSKSIVKNLNAQTTKLLGSQIPSNADWTWNYDAREGGWAEFTAGQRKEP